MESDRDAVASGPWMHKSWLWATIKPTGLSKIGRHAFGLARMSQSKRPDWAKTAPPSSGRRCLRPVSDLSGLALKPLKSTATGRISPDAIGLGNKSAESVNGLCKELVIFVCT